MADEFEVQTQHWVYVTHITNPLDFYVRHVKYSAICEYLETNEPQAKKAELNLNDVIMFKKDNTYEPKYARGKILGMETQENVIKYDIFALDYGCFCKAIPEEYIWECISEYVTTPPLAVACELANCTILSGDEWSSGSISSFKWYVADAKTKMSIMDKTGDKLIVMLRNYNFNDIGTLLHGTGFSALGHDYNATNVPAYIAPELKNLSTKDIQVDNKMRVRVQSARSATDFHVMEINDFREYVKMCNNMADYAYNQPTLPIDQMKKDAVVLVRNDDRPDVYERAVIRLVLIPGKLALVKLLDTGIEDLAYIKNMKVIPQECMRMPIAAFHCATEGEGTWFNFVVKHIFPGSLIFIKINYLSLGEGDPNYILIAARQ